MIPEIVFVHCDVGEVGAFGHPVVSLSAVSRLKQPSHVAAALPASP